MIPLRKIDLYEDEIGSVELIECMGSDLTVVNSARVSFGKQKMTMDKKDEKLIRYLIKNRHTSPFEHCVATFRFVVPLFVRSQHHRHRTWSFNEISRRYTSEEIQFYAPKQFRLQHESNRQASASETSNPMIELNDTIIKSDSEELREGSNFIIGPSSDIVVHHHEKCLRLFNTLLDAGICREQARGVLPQNMYTQYYGSVNLNNLLKFIELRSHEGAQWEIQRVAEACLEIAKELWPVSVDAFNNRNT